MEKTVELINEMRDKLSLQIHKLAQNCIKLMKGELEIMDETEKLYKEITNSLDDHKKVYLQDPKSQLVVQDCIDYAKKIIDNCKKLEEV